MRPSKIALNDVDERRSAVGVRLAVDGAALRVEQVEDGHRATRRS